MKYSFVLTLPIFLTAQP